MAIQAKRLQTNILSYMYRIELQCYVTFPVCLQVLFVGSAARDVFFEVAHECKDLYGHHKSLVIVAIQPPRISLSYIQTT